MPLLMYVPAHVLEQVYVSACAPLRMLICALFCALVCMLIYALFCVPVRTYLE